MIRVVVGLLLLLSLSLPAQSQELSSQQVYDLYIRARNHRRAGELAQAQALSNQLLRESARVWGSNSSNYAGALNEVGLLYRALKQPAKAEPLHRRALAIAESVNGPNHVKVAIELNNIAGICADTGRHAEAEPLRLRALRIYESHYSPTDPELANAHNDLGLLYLEMKQAAKAEASFRTSLRIRERGPKSGDAIYYGTLESLADALHQQKRYDEAEALFLRVLKAHESRRGPDNPDQLNALLGIVNVYSATLQTTKVIEFYARLLRVKEAKYGPNHREVAITLAFYAHALGSLGRQDEAVAMLQRAIKINESQLGADHPDVALNLRLLAMLFMDMGQYARAEPIYRRAIGIQEAKLGASHPELAVTLTNLGKSYVFVRQEPKAQPLFERAVKILRAKPDANPRWLADAVNHLGSLYVGQGRLANAEQLYREGIQILEAKLGAEHPDLAGLLGSLANLQLSQGQIGEAERQFRRSLVINEKVFGPSHPNAALYHSRIGAAYLRQGRLAEALPPYKKSLDIYVATLGENHPYTIGVLHDLAKLSQDLGQNNEAMAYHHRQRRGSRIFLLRELPGLPDRDQLIYLAGTEAPRFNDAVSLGWQMTSRGASADQSAEWLANGKGMAVESQATRLRLAREVRDEAGRATLRELNQIRSRVAAMVHQADDGGAADARRQQRQKLEERARELEGQLGRTAGAAPGLGKPWVELSEVRTAIPLGAVLIDVARVTPRGMPQATTPRYIAWIVPHKGGGPVATVDLGEAAPIDDAVKAARDIVAKGSERVRAIGEPAAFKEALDKLEPLAGRILKPIRDQLKNATTLIFCPDGDLWLVPWAALPDGNGRSLIESHAIHFVTSARDLLPSPVGRAIPPSAPVMLADPDFDAAPGATVLAGRSGAGRLGDADVYFSFAVDGRFTLRSGSSNTGEIIGSGTWRRLGMSVQMETERSTYEGKWTGSKLSGQRRRKDVPSTPPDDWSFQPPRNEGDSRSLPLIAGKMAAVARLPGTAAEAEASKPILRRLTGADPHVLTDVQASEAIVKDSRHPAVLVLATHGFFISDSAKLKADVDNPLLRCGLLLAGCNRRDNDVASDDDGILTGLEIIGCDLRGTQLVILSACETGLGTVQVGNGVAGLRQAFQLAGAGSVVASLWNVPDRDTALLMVRFFDERVAGKNNADALRAAQLARIDDRRKRFGAAHPFFWSAFTVTGK